MVVILPRFGGWILNSISQFNTYINLTKARPLFMGCIKKQGADGSSNFNNIHITCTKHNCVICHTINGEREREN